MSLCKRSEILSIAKSSTNKSINYIHFDLNNKMEFIDDNSIDFIIAPLFIHYIINLQQAFLDYYRILRNKGILIFSTHQPHIIYQKHNLNNYFESQIISEFWTDVGNVQFYHHSLDTIFSNILNAGFVIKNIEEPKPLDLMKKADLNLYNSMTKNPYFLFGVLAKND